MAINATDLHANFLHGQSQNLPVNIQEGTFLFTDDDGNFYLDINNHRYWLNKKVVYAKTTAEWNATPNAMSERDIIYVYTDATSATVNDQTVYLPNFKIGDGLAYIVDLPFASNAQFMSHINNAQIHIIQAERVFWNNKVSIDVSDIANENLIFSIN